MSGVGDKRAIPKASASWANLPQRVKMLTQCVAALWPLASPDLMHEFQQGGLLTKLKPLPGAPGFPWDKCDFGFIPGGAIWTMKGGTVTVGSTDYTCTDTAFAPNTPVAYLGWQFLYASLALSLVNFGATRPPGADVNGIYKWLLKLQQGDGTSYTAGTPYSVVEYGYFDQAYPGNYDPTPS